MALGWKPQLVAQDASREGKAAPWPQSVTLKIPRTPARSASAEFLSRVSIDSSPDPTETVSREKPQPHGNQKPSVMKTLPIRRSRSAEQMGSVNVSNDMGDDRKAVSQELKQPATRILHSDRESRQRRMMIDKPLPIVAAL